ncbi:MAG: methyl-accepting chemotaxis protein [Epsilonproteobacteria bacterium]|nr:methyl-accepting chemotaxis protein [Campylobacterota bacterium]
MKKAYTMFKNLKFFHKLLAMNTLPMVGLMFLSTIVFWTVFVFLEEFKTSQDVAKKVLQAYEYVYENKPYKFEPVVSSPFEIFRQMYMKNYKLYKQRLNQELEKLQYAKDKKTKEKIFKDILLDATRVVIDENIKNVFLEMYEDPYNKEYISHLKHISSKSLGLFYFLFWFFLIGGLVSVGLATMLAYFMVKSINEGVGNIKSTLDEILKNKNLAYKSDYEAKDEIGEIIKNINSFIEKLREIVEDMKKFAYDTTQTSGNILEKTEELQNVTVDELEKIKHLVKSVMEIENKLNAIIVGMNDLNKTQKQVNDEFSESVENIVVLNEIISSNEEIVQELTEALHTLITNIENTKEFTDIIKDIADQTNLLALNASIEAARAGEAGRGFAVVAEEVRALSEKTRKNADDISAQVSAIIQLVEDISQKMDKNSSNTTDITKQSEIINTSINTLKTNNQKLLEISHKNEEEISSAFKELQRLVNLLKTIEKQADVSLNNVKTINDFVRYLYNKLKDIYSKISELKT